jgi:hypothetical protein
MPHLNVMFKLPQLELIIILLFGWLLAFLPNVWIGRMVKCTSVGLLLGNGTGSYWYGTAPAPRIVNNGGPRLQECTSFRKVSQILIKQSHCDCSDSKTELINIDLDLPIVILLCRPCVLHCLQGLCSISSSRSSSC